MGEPTPNREDDSHIVVVDFAKQLITLASGVIALSATFIPDFAILTSAQLAILGCSWIALTCSILFSLLSISAVIASRSDPLNYWSMPASRKFARIGMYVFLAGISLFAFFAFAVLLMLQA